MSLLKDGRFLFVHARRHYLCLEEPFATASPAPPCTKSSAVLMPRRALLIYGGDVRAYALDASQSRIALVCPEGSAVAPSEAVGDSCRDRPHSVLRLFSFSRGEVGELIDEMVTPLARSVSWVGAKFIILEVQEEQDLHSGSGAAASPPPPTATSTVLMEVSGNPQRLRWIRRDNAAVAPTAAPASTLCDIRSGKQALRFWDLLKGKLRQEFRLPLRRRRHGKVRRAVATCSDGPFVLIGNDDSTVHVFHVSARGIRELQPMLSQFESHAVNMANSHGSVAATRDVTDAAERSVTLAAGNANAPAPSSATVDVENEQVTSHASPRPHMFVRALSDTQFLVALKGCPTVLQCACDMKADGEELAVVAKMRLPRLLQESGELIGLSSRGCLVCQTEEPLEADRASAPTSEPLSHLKRSHVLSSYSGEVNYFLVPLDMKPTGRGPVEIVEKTHRGEHSACTVDAEATSHDGCATRTPREVEEMPTTQEKRKRKKKKETGMERAVSSASKNPAESPEVPIRRGLRAEDEAVTANGCRLNGSTGTSGVSPLQRALSQLLRHAGVVGNGQAPASESEKYISDVSDGVPGENVASPFDSADTAPLRGDDGHSTDWLITFGGVLVGMAIGVWVMRQASLL